MNIILLEIFKKSNLDNLYKKHLPLLYITLDQKYVIADKDDLIFKNNILNYE